MDALKWMGQLALSSPDMIEALEEVLAEPDCPVKLVDGKLVRKSYIETQSGEKAQAVVSALADPQIKNQLPSLNDSTKHRLVSKTSKPQIEVKPDVQKSVQSSLKPVTESLDDFKLKLESLQENDEVLTIKGPQGAEFPYLKIKANPKFENMYSLWGEDEDGNIYNEVKYSTLQNTIFQIKKYKEQTMTESVKSNQETDIIYYRSLPVEVNIGNPGGYYDDSFGNWLPDDRYVTHYVDWEYELPKEDIMEALGDFLSEEEDEHLKNLSDDEFWTYIEQHYDELFKKYETRLEDKFYDAAIEDAAENIDWDSYGEPDYDDIDECLRTHYDDEGHYVFKDFRDAADVELKEFWDEPKDQCEEEFKPTDTQLEMEGLDANDPILKFTDYEWTEQDPESTKSGWEEVASKNVFDSDGFLTDYVWYTDGDRHVFVFGDSDRYKPEDGDFDWEIDIVEGKEAEAYKEAQDWFNSYKGFEEEDPDFDEVVLEDEPVLEDFKAQDCLTESYMSDLSVDMQEAGGKERLIKSLERQVLALQSELDFLNTIAPREVGAGGSFDSMEEVKEAVAQTEKALRTAQAKLGILKEGK